MIRARVPARQSPTAIILVIALALAAVCVVVARVPSARADVLTNSADNSRDGWYPNQPGLSPSVVGGSTFGQLASLDVTGQVYGQPVVSNGTLVVATEHDMVYGFDTQTRQLKWSLSVGKPVAPLGATATAAGCTDISPEIGITSTPVVDPLTNTVYLVASVNPAGGAASDASFFMHALDVSTGAERPGWPVQIQGAADNDPTAVFNGKVELQRPGLLLMNGVVYAGFSGHCDYGVYRGYIAGISTTTAQRTALWTDEAAPDAQTADGPGGGIWMSGSGLMSDQSGDIVVSTGNGTPPPAGPGSTATGALGQSEVRVRVQPDGTLAQVDHFAPSDAAQLNTNDSDVGSGGVIALPSQFGTATHPRLLAMMGKQGVLWVTDAGHLGGVAQGPNLGDDVVARLALNSGGLRGRPAAWGGDGGYMYLASSQAGGGTGRLYAFKYGVDGNGNPTFAQVARTSDLFGFGSGSPVVTSDGTTSGSALVWTVWFPSAPPSGQPIGTGAQLRAYSAVPVNGTMNLVYSAPIANGNKFSMPAVDNGTLYLGTADGHVLVFGTPVSAPLSGGTVAFPTTTVGQTSTMTETVTANSALTISGASVTGPGFSVTGSSPGLPVGVPAGGTASIQLAFSPTAGGGAAGVLTVNTSAGPVTFSLSGSGQSAGPKLAQDPCCLSFGGVPVGSQVNGTVLFSNTGASPLVFDSYDLPTGPFTVSGLPAPGSSLAPGGSFVATFTFAPTTTGVFGSSLILNTNDPTAVGFNGPNESAAPGAVALSGSGGTQSVMRLTPQTVSFGAVPIGTTATQTFTVSNVGGTDMNINISKTPGGDFSAVSNLPEGSVIAPGTSVTETVSYTPTTTGAATSDWAITGDDGTGRQDVTFTGTGTTALLPSVSVGDIDVQRPTSGTTTANVPVTLSRPSASTVTMAYSTKDGSATTADGDYVPTSGTLTFNPGETSKFVSVTVNSAAATSSQETFSLTVGTLRGVVSADSAAKVYLIGTPLPSSISVSDATAAAAAGSPAELTYTLTASPPPVAGKTVTVRAATSDGTAVAASGDYTPVSTTVSFTAAAPVQQVTVPVTKLPANGATKTVLLNLSSVSSGSNIGDTSAVGTVYTTAPPVPAITVGDVALVRPTSGTANAVFTVTLSRPVTTTVPFTYNAVPGTGTTVADFAATSGSTSFAPGQTSVSITVPITGSATATGTNTVVLNLSKQSGASLADSAAKAYLVSPITHDFLSVQPASTWVGPSLDTVVNVPVVLASPSPRTVQITAATVDGTALAGTDYTATSAALTFAPGTSVAYLTVPVLHQPGVVSPNRTFTVKLSGDSGVTTLSSGSAAVTLVEHGGNVTVPPTPTAPAFTAVNPPTTAVVGTPYSYTVVAAGTPTPGYTIVSGGLPIGLGLNAVSGAISGTPTVAGSYTVVLGASNGVGPPVSSAAITITVTGGAGGD